MPQVQHSRGRYHHGDLANALAGAAIELARQGGPEAIVLREAARQVGVSATAAYRHFASHGDLMLAVKEHCQTTLVRHMEIEAAASEPTSDRGEAAIRRLRALGRGYIRFALAEPGFFRTAFCHSELPEPDGPGPVPGMLESPAFAMLTEVLDELTRLGLLPAQQRPYTEMVAWSSAHGLANLLVDGPLRVLPEEQREAVITRTLDATIAGICTGLSTGPVG